jgi:hypothetical protein
MTDGVADGPPFSGRSRGEVGAGRERVEVGVLGSQVGEDLGDVDGRGGDRSNSATPDNGARADRRLG